MKQQKNMEHGNTSTKVLSMKWFWKIWKRTGSIIWNIFREWVLEESDDGSGYFTSYFCHGCYDYDKYTEADVRRALAHDNRTPEDFQALLSPAALPLLEEIAQAAQKETRKHLGTVCMFTPIYIANYCENYCIYCGLTAIIRSAEQSWMQKRLIRKWLLSQRQDCRKFWFSQERAEQNRCKIYRRSM